jgi:glucose 1-dehydrogenase
MEFESRVAVITGGAVRIGRELTLALAQRGCDVLIHYGKSAGPAEETKSAAEAYGVRADIYGADLTKAVNVNGIIPAAVSRFGRVDILINNAAIFLEGDLRQTTQQMWDRQFAVNLRAPYLLCRDFARQLPEDHHGAIVNIGDARIYRPGADHFAYRLTKHALQAMTENLALDLAPSITVNAVALGAILPPPGEGIEFLKGLTQTLVPLGKPGNPQTVAENVLHLLSQDFLTGVTVRIDGGQFL